MFSLKPRIFWLFYSLLCLSLHASNIAEHLRYNLGFNLFIMDHEGYTTYWPDTNTTLNTRLTPEFGFAFNTKSVEQKLMVGAFFFQNIHTYQMNFPSKWGPTLYYQARGHSFNFYGGIFPRKYLNGHYPLNVFAPYYWFIDPNARGFLLQYRPPKNPYKSTHLEAEFMLDWFGGNCYTCKFGHNDAHNGMDRFSFMGYSELKTLKGFLILGGNAEYFHVEDQFLLNWPNTSGNIPRGGHYLLDRLYYQFYAKSDLLNAAPFMDRLDFSLGVLANLERLRKMEMSTDFKISNGFFAQANMQFKGFGISDLFFASKYGQNAYEDKYNNLYIDEICTASKNYCPTPIYRGVAFFQAPLYNRLDIYYEFRSSFASIKTQFVYNTMSNYHTTQSSYQVYFTVSLDSYDLLNFILRKVHR
ncbi:hypothetical protein NHP190012_06910 [Helicobacter sp. NHP19-012]|uniref:Outer membrane protein n=1 Tax=Helicobacter gastrofelis TaxID=2849642 RepID=A0ABN6I8V7_9HELI|nr:MULTISPECIES: hypothetical protein [unclassified Helicobacter]BCZ19049.1 hypothetical protein NHP190012_06910 [Helicobacter sp. NHP19-012]GMB96600.1 hypothetical protein NHP22001_11890 [Helicobacter sp. NHP22-001]